MVTGADIYLCFFFQAEDGIRDLVRSRGLGDVYKRQWLGNIGYLRRSYTAADLVYRDPNGEDHIYYGARWDDLNSEWLQLSGV